MSNNVLKQTKQRHVPTLQKHVRMNNQDIRKNIKSFKVSDRPQILFLIFSKFKRMNLLPLIFKRNEVNWFAKICLILEVKFGDGPLIKAPLPTRATQSEAFCRTVVLTKVVKNWPRNTWNVLLFKYNCWQRCPEFY